MEGFPDRNFSTIKVLYLAANPMNTVRLQLDEEIRTITEKIRAADYRDSLELVPMLATRPDDLLQSLNVYKPQVVHFSGHGWTTGEIILVGQDGSPKPIGPPAIKALFRAMKDNVRVVLLNACFSRIQAKAITDVIECAIGMNIEIGDRAAIVFAASFYRAIGFGRSVQESFDQGIIALQLEGIPEESTPELLVKAGVNPSSIVLINPIENLAVKESRSLLQRAQNALRRDDYTLAKRDLEKVLEILDDTVQPEEAARARYLLALVFLEGKRPFSQKLSVMRSVEELLRSAIMLHRSYSYIFTLAICKLDFARNGLPQLVSEAKKLISEAGYVDLTAKDEENLKLLANSQPGLARDYLTKE